MIIPAIRIGTAGWAIPARYARAMPESGSLLERYAARFDAVEINSSFHRPHRRSTYERWAANTPASFRFSVKLPKTVTHEALLTDCDPLLTRFADEVKGLGEKLAVLLVQLPPKLAFDAASASRFFASLQDLLPADIAVEPRHASWFAPDADRFLSERRIARVAADPPRAAAAACDPAGWRGLVYYRVHGSPRMYYSDYDAATLASLKDRLARAREDGAASWCIFDNTASGAALGNALALTEALQTR